MSCKAATKLSLAIYFCQVSVKFRHVACVTVRYLVACVMVRYLVACVMVRYLVACVCYLDLQVSSVQCCTELLSFLSVSKQQLIFN